MVANKPETTAINSKSAKPPKRTSIFTKKNRKSSTPCSTRDKSPPIKQYANRGSFHIGWPLYDRRSRSSASTLNNWTSSCMSIFPVCYCPNNRESGFTNDNRLLVRTFPTAARRRNRSLRREMDEILMKLVFRDQGPCEICHLRVIFHRFSSD